MTLLLVLIIARGTFAGKPARDKNANAAKFKFHVDDDVCDCAESSDEFDYKIPASDFLIQMPSSRRNQTVFAVFGSFQSLAKQILKDYRP